MKLVVALFLYTLAAASFGKQLGIKEGKEWEQTHIAPPICLNAPAPEIDYYPPSEAK